MTVEYGEMDLMVFGGPPFGVPVLKLLSVENWDIGFTSLVKDLLNGSFRVIGR